MRERKKYDPEFKLSVVKEYLSDDTLYIKDICNKYSISQSAFFRWIKKYRESNFDDNVFFVKTRKTRVYYFRYF